MTITVTESIPSVVIPPYVIDMLFNKKLNWLEVGAYCRLRYRCKQALTGTYAASEAELARLGVDYSVLYQLRTKNLIRWAIKDDVQQIQMVER